MSETTKGEVGFTVTEAKEQKKRDSIMNELYNDISSSSDENEDETDDKDANLTDSNTDAV